MLRNFITSAIRNLLRNKSFTILNIGGLILGVGCSIVLFSYIQFETSFNKEYKNFDRIYRVTLDVNVEQYQGKIQQIPHPLMKALKAEMSGAEEYVQMFNHGEAQISIAEGDQFKHYVEDDIAFTDAGLFRILDFKWLAGNGQIDDPRSVVINRSLAEKYFGVKENFQSILGQTILIDNTHDLTIKGVFEDVSNQSDFQFNMFIDYDSQQGVNDYFGEGKIWGRLNGRTNGFLLLPENGDPILATQQANIVWEKHNVMEGATIFLQPLSDMHYNTEIGPLNVRPFPRQATWTLMVIAVLLIVASSINFINLSTAKATNRAKEVGIRKVLGSSRKNLILQQLSETFIVVVLSMLGALGLAEILFKVISPIIGQELSLTVLPTYWTLCMISVTIVVLTALTGLYPAFVVSGFKPIQALKVSLGGVTNKGSMSLRRILVVLQFVISQGLLIGTMVTIMQNDYLRTKDLGFKQEGIISIELPEIDNNKTALLKNQLLQLPEVSTVSAHLGSPVARVNNTSDMIYKNSEGSDIEINMNQKSTDEDYLELFGLELLAGENLVKGDTSRNILVNRETVRKMGLDDPQEAVGQFLSPEYAKDRRMVIKGVVSDFNSRSLRDEVMPVMMTHSEDYFYELAFGLANTSTENISSVLKKLDDIWFSVYPEYVLKYDFLDESIRDAYEAESRMVQLFQIFAGIAILIGCLGLYGLVDFIAIKRTKEIGIRKVLGASVLNILVIFVRELLILVTLSAAIIGPVMYFLMQRWLEDYAYHIDLGFGIFIFSFLVISLFAIATMGYRSVKASNLNPVLTLKDE